MLNESKYNMYILSNGNCYIYNLLYRSLVLVKTKVVEAVKQHRFENISKKTIDTLIKYGMLLDENEDEYEVMLSHFVSNLTKMQDYAVFLSLTAKCNLACDYCYQDYRATTDYSNEYMNKEKVDLYCQYIENLKDQYNLKCINVVFFGGEPLLCKEKFNYVLERINSIIIEKKYSIITNGTLIDKDIIDLFEKYKISVQITFDGDQELHDRKRVYLLKDGQKRGTFDNIWEKVKLLLDRIPKQTIIRMNIHQNDSAPYLKLIDKLTELDNKPTTISLGSLIDGQSPESQHQIRDYECISEIRAYAKEKNLSVSNSFIVGPCMYHTMWGSAVDENLNVYPCPGFLYSKNGGFINEFGYHVKNDFWFETLKKVPECVKECKYAPICFGGCKMNKKCNKDYFDRNLENSIKEHIMTSHADVSFSDTVIDNAYVKG